MPKGNEGNQEADAKERKLAKSEAKSDFFSSQKAKIVDKHDGNKKRLHHKPPLKSRWQGQRTWTDEEIADALRKNRGLKTPTAQYLGCNQATVYSRCQDSPMLQRVCKEARDAQLDTTENKLFQLIDNGEAPSVHFFLKTIGKGRGYVERSEVDDGKGAIFSDSPQLASLRKAIQELPKEKLEKLLSALKEMES